jgi:hypothetical protein
MRGNWHTLWRCGRIGNVQKSRILANCRVTFSSRPRRVRCGGLSTIHSGKLATRPTHWSKVSLLASSWAHSSSPACPVGTGGWCCGALNCARCPRPWIRWAGSQRLSLHLCWRQAVAWLVACRDRGCLMSTPPVPPRDLWWPGSMTRDNKIPGACLRRWGDRGGGGPLAGVGEAGKGSGTRCRSREGEKLAVVAGGSGGADPIANGREADKGQPSAQATEGNGGDGRRGSTREREDSGGGWECDVFFR